MSKYGQNIADCRLGDVFEFGGACPPVGEETSPQSYCFERLGAFRGSRRRRLHVTDKLDENLRSKFLMFFSYAYCHDQALVDDPSRFLDYGVNNSKTATFDVIRTKDAHVNSLSYVSTGGEGSSIRWWTQPAQFGCVRLTPQVPCMHAGNEKEESLYGLNWFSWAKRGRLVHRLIRQT